jgi:hypothetical protein
MAVIWFREQRGPELLSIAVIVFDCVRNDRGRIRFDFRAMTDIRPDRKTAALDPKLPVDLVTSAAALAGVGGTVGPSVRAVFRKPCNRLGR